MQAISGEDLKKKIDGGEAVTLLDLQEPHSYEHRHIPGAVNIVVDEHCKDECSRLIQNKDAAIVVYDEFAGLGKAERVSGILVGLGCENVVVLKDGLMGWMEVGYTVEGGKDS